MGQKRHAEGFFIFNISTQYKAIYVLQAHNFYNNFLRKCEISTILKKYIVYCEYIVYFVLI